MTRKENRITFMKQLLRLSPAGAPVTLLVILAFFLPAPAAAQGGAYDHGLLWKIEGGGAAPSYLFGTMHSADPEVATPPRTLRRILAAVDSLTVEVVIDQQVQMEISQAMLLPDGMLLGDIAGPGLLQRTVETGARYGLPAPVVQRFRPWALYTIFSLPPSELQRQAAGEVALDKVLENYAQESGLPIYQLEEPGEQLSVLAGYPEEDQLRLLDLTIAHQHEVEDYFQRMKGLYLAGDLSGMNAIMTESMAELPPDLMQDFDQKLVTERNHRMAERMTSRLAEGNALIAVGALHLYGEQGIPALLAAAGYTVTPVE